MRKLSLLLLEMMHRVRNSFRFFLKFDSFRDDFLLLSPPCRPNSAAAAINLIIPRIESHSRRERKKERRLCCCFPKREREREKERKKKERKKKEKRKRKKEKRKRKKEKRKRKKEPFRQSVFSSYSAIQLLQYRSS